MPAGWRAGAGAWVWRWVWRAPGHANVADEAIGRPMGAGRDNCMSAYDVAVLAAAPLAHRHANVAGGSIARTGGHSRDIRMPACGFSG